jgi:glycosyltransferase involved in cell wall biosynthesis
MTGRPMRLGYIADPNSIHTRRWIGWFAGAGHEVHLLDPFGATVTPGLPPRVEVHRLDLPAGPPVVGLWARRRALGRALERIGIQVLHAQFVRRYGWQAGLSGFHPLVVSPWGSDVLRVRRRSLRTRWWNRFALRSADLVTVSSAGMRAAALRAGARADRIELVHHGVDTARFSPGPPRPPRQPRILSIRALAPLYHHETAIDAIALLGDEGLRPNVVLTRLGARATYAAELQQRAIDRGIAEQVTWLDAVPHDELPDLYRSGDVLVSIPETDSFPVTLLEAMACGLPAVVSDVPAVEPVYGAIAPAARELIVPVGDAVATAAALRKAIGLSADDRARLGARLRDFVIATADYDTHMARMERLYRGLVER